MPTLMKVYIYHLFVAMVVLSVLRSHNAPTVCCRVVTPLRRRCVVACGCRIACRGLPPLPSAVRCLIWTPRLPTAGMVSFGCVAAFTCPCLRCCRCVEPRLHARYAGSLHVRYRRFGLRLPPNTPRLRAVAFVTDWMPHLPHLLRTALISLRAYAFCRPVLPTRVRTLPHYPRTLPFARCYVAL